jgi:hypothetical protein
MPITEEDLTPYVPKEQQEEKEEESLAEKGFLELVKIAQERGVPGAATMSHKDLIIALGTAPKGKAVYDRTIGITNAELEQARTDRKAIPSSTIYDPKDKEKLEKIWKHQPMAFNNYDLTDEKARLVFHFEQDIKCACGEEMAIARVYTAKKDGRDIERTEYKDIYERLCPKCGRKHIYLDPDREPPVDPGIARKLGFIP